MIQLDRVSKAYGGQEVFRDVSWRIGDGERIGLVGPNGAGKSTLCRILAGFEPPDAGEVIRARTTTVGYLPQEVGGVGGDTSVLVEALSGFAEVWRLEREMEDVAAQLETTHDPALTERYGTLQHRFDALGGYRLETEARVILGGLGFTAGDMTRPLSELSGGWRMRAALARLLMLRPSLLLLDEPTNHLDLGALAWLETFLDAYEGTLVVVSHDRYFLNRMVTSIADLGPAGLERYTGDYDDYLVEREARRELLEARAANQAKRVAEVERFIERFRYQATKARQVQSRVKMLDRIERIAPPPRARRIHFTFPAPARTGRRVAMLRGLHKAYGAHVVYAGVDFELERGERVALVGPNGAGKSTLLRIVAGALAFERGERVLGAGVTVHYYAQHQVEALDPRRTALEELEAAAPNLGQTRLRSILGAFLFSGDAADKPVAVLSGGEKARLALARMLVRPAALLAVDEPTNHLDLVSREVLEEALAAFPGTIVFISHDRYFINRLATRVIEVDGGRLTSYPGIYDDYVAARARASESMGGLDGPPRPPGARGAPAKPWHPSSPPALAHASGGCASHPPGPPGRGSGSDSRDGSARRQEPATRERRRSQGEVRKLRIRLDVIERRVAELEARLGEIAALLAAPEVYRDGDRARAVLAEQKDAEAEVAGLLSEWEDVSAALAEED